MSPSNSLENKTNWDTCWRVELLCKKVQAPSSCEPALEYNQDQIPLKGDMDIWSYGNMQFQMQMQKATPLGHWIEEADLPLVRTILAIHQKSQEPSFWEVIDSFVLLVYASLAASKTLLQQLLACLDFTLCSEDISFWYIQKSDLYELWQ